MKSRRQRATPAAGVGGRKKVPSDVSPSTSLPPLVEGQLRCFLQVTISRILWTVHKPPPATFVRLRWWGESSDGTHFLPRDGSQLSQKAVKITSRFAIRCGPKQFTSYLTDMGSMVLEVLTKPDHLPIARAEVAGISRLSLSHPISGFYTLVSPTSEKLGELQVSLNLEPLTEAYDSSSSCPPTDISVEQPQVTTLTVPSRPRSISAGSGKESVGSSSENTPRGKDHLYFQNPQRDEGKDEFLENQMPTTNRSQDSQRAVNPSGQEPRGQTTNDILSEILERGNKLRNAMVLSALTYDMDSAPALKDAPLPLSKDNILPSFKPVLSPSGMFLQNMLHADSSLEPSDDVALVPDCDYDCIADIDNRAIDILLGSLNTSPLPLWDGDCFLPEALSGYSSVCLDSELNDPQYDTSLLENLFYKTPMSDTRPDDTEPEGQGPGSSSRNLPTQLTQSGPKISGGPNSAHQRSPDTGDLPDLSAEQLSLLSLIREARVTIKSLTVQIHSKTTTPRKTSSKGKPPRPLTSKKCTYFVEYSLPMAPTSSRHDSGKAGDGEVIRAVSSKVTAGAVKFLQHSVSPVHFSTATVKLWCQTDLIFKIYSRKSDQKKAVPIGKAVHPLRCLLQSKQLSQYVVLPVQSLEGNRDLQEIGPLVVSLELAAGGKVNFSGKSKSKLPRRETSPSQTEPIQQRDPTFRSHLVQSGREDSPAIEDSRLNVWTPQQPSKGPSSHPAVNTPPYESWQQADEDPKVLLHTLLMVPDGKNFSCGPMQTPNVYLNCKLFWCDEMARSVVSWGQANPSFNFAQVTPVALTTKLLERMKNNLMVIEVWQKTGSSGQDRLLGLVKLPLHQFYMSFRDPKIAHILLQAQYPVLGVDCYMPIMDVFSGSCKGNLRVVLAMGGSEQIVALQRTRDDEYDNLSHLVKPVHLLDHQARSQTKVTAAKGDDMREHLFVIKVEKVNGLTPLQSTVWGEADCYIQYSFPCQDSDAAASLDQSIIESSVNLKPFRTTTSLCVPDPEFGHTETHVLVVPEGVPVQRLLLSSLSSQGLCGGGGVQFEVWCRYYYPNVRDQLVAKGLLPLSKLCAMVTMQRQQPNEAHMFSLPLIPRTDNPTGHQPHPSGLLDVCIRYKHRPVRREGQTGRGAASRVVTLVVQVHRASGLQAAARLLSKQDVGVNIYVTVQLSFLPESERRCTRTVARTFCPEFDHHMEMSCDLLVQRSSGETYSLAEQLEEASAVFTVWNRDNRKAVIISKPKDVMLGTVKIPLADLINKRTGISGWFGVYIPQETSSQDMHQQVLVGGLEISVNFAHNSDRERVIKAGQGLGWVLNQSDHEMQDEEEAWEESMKKLSLTFSMPRVWMPVHCLLLPDHSDLQRSTYCYFRYKFYDQEAFCSQMKHPSVVEGGEDSQATVSFEGSKTLELRRTQPLLWYLREEKLEVQVWVAFKKEKTRRPTDTDQLVGSAFVDLSSLVKMPKKKLTLSGVYPLFRRSASDLQGAALRVHITLTAASIPREGSAAADTQMDSDSQGEHFSEEDRATDRRPSLSTPKKSAHSGHKTKTSRTTADITSEQHTEMSLDESIPVTVTVDQAMHLNLKGCPLAERSEGTPCCCVSYVTADSTDPVSTAVIADTNCPMWDHQHECRLSNQLLVDPQQCLVFKVWHRGETERVLGFASVDLSPLLCGFYSVCGWYNITDFGGQCRGQLKVSITPLKGVHHLRGQRRAVNEEAAKNSSTLFQGRPLSYHTTATYSSFPSHISRFPEQKISSPDRTDMLFPKSSNERDSHLEHMEKVRLYHQSLQEQAAAISGDLSPSRSFLFSSLRKKLSELDNIQRFFSPKPSAPKLPSVTEHDRHNKHEEQGTSERNTNQLLLKSNQLVGEVNNIMSALQADDLEMIPSNPQSDLRASSGHDHNPQTIPETISRFTSSQQDVSLSLQKMSDDHPDSGAEEEKDGQHHKVLEDENEERTDEYEDGTTCTRDKGVDDDEEEDEDYDEVVVKPRHLNEVTSLTDRTSPWTSIHSDPDMVSLESLEAPEDSDPSQDEDDKQSVVNLETCDSDGKHQSATLEEIESCNGSGDDSDTERRVQDPQSPNEESGDKDASPALQYTTDSPDCSLDDEDSQLQTSAPVVVSNFFLPSHQMEASMRAIQLAPSFSNPPSDPGRISPLQSFPRRRGRPQRPDLSPSSMKKETERIAKIFAAHFDKSH